MSLVNQPFNGQLGDILIGKLQENYNRLTIVVAFAKNSGVLRLKPELERFRANGGVIHIFVGVDIQGTSYEALKNLLSLCDSLYVVHSEDSATTFHSKVFLLENDMKIWIAIGSNNLTGGGLWTNFESCQCQEFPIGTPECDEFRIPFSELIARYTNNDCEYSRKIENADDIYELERAGYLVHEVWQRFNQNEERTRRLQAGGDTRYSAVQEELDSRDYKQEK
jgi:Predicted HKD family nuclease